MALTYHDLKSKTLAELREVAKGLDQEAVHGFSQMNKDHLLPLICKVMGIDTFEHHTATGIDKPKLKARIRELKKKRDEALQAHDHVLLKNLRREMHHLTHDIRKHLS